jgi:hypothetical protein
MPFDEMTLKELQTAENRALINIFHTLISLFVY